MMRIYVAILVSASIAQLAAISMGGAATDGLTRNRMGTWNIKETALGREVLRAGRIALSPVEWELVNGPTAQDHESRSLNSLGVPPEAVQGLTLERVPRPMVTGSTAELQKQLEQAVESKDYELAASLKRKIDSAESVSPVAEEVWKGPRRKKLPSLPSVVTWISSPLHVRQPASGATCPAANEAGTITGEICRNVAIGVWSKIVAGENEARADELEAAELLVRQILMRAAHLGHRHVRLSALDIRGQNSQQRSDGSYTMPCPNIVCWTVHQEMVAAAFALAAVQDCEGDPRTYTLASARNANVASFAQKTLETGQPVTCSTRKDKLKYCTRVPDGETTLPRPVMSRTDFVEHAAATFHQRETTPGWEDCGEMLQVEFGAYDGRWILGRNAGLKSTLDALDREWRDAEECLQSAFELSRNTDRTSAVGDREMINVKTKSTYCIQHSDEDSDECNIPDFLEMYPRLPWDTSMSYFDTSLASLDGMRLDGVLTAKEHRMASEDVVLAGRFLHEQLYFESSLSAGGPETLATLLSSDPVASLMLCWRLQQAGFNCELADDKDGDQSSEATQYGADPGGSALVVDLFLSHQNDGQENDLATFLAEYPGGLDAMGWG
jgi:hypothetical protein